MSQTYQLPKAITLTERAAARVKHIMAKSETPMLGVRLGVKNGGCRYGIHNGLCRGTIAA